METRDRPQLGRRCESGGRRGRCRGWATERYDGMWLCPSHLWLRQGGISRKERRIINDARVASGQPPI